MIVIALTSLHVESIDVHAISHSILSLTNIWLAHDHPVPHLHIILSLINIISIVILIAGFPKTCQTALQATIHSQVNHALYYNFQCHSLSLINTFSLHALKYHQSILPHLFLKGDNAQGSSDGRVESLKEICSGSVIDSILWTTWYWYCDHIIMPKIYLISLPAEENVIFESKDDKRKIGLNNEMELVRQQHSDALDDPTMEN